MSTWRTSRQIGYISSIIIFFLLIGGFYYWFNLPEPSCFDGIQNQGERGVDCGGPCERICSFDVLPLKILWTRYFEVSPGVYSAVALVENQNVNSGVYNVPYNLQLVTSNGVVLIERQGMVKALPETVFAIFESNMVAPSGLVSRALLNLDQDLYWQEVTEREPLMRIFQRSFVNTPSPRLVANITNETVADYPRVEVVVVMSDASGNALATSRTVVTDLNRRSSRDIVFTWPRPFSVGPSIIDFYYSVLDPGF